MKRISLLLNRTHIQLGILLIFLFPLLSLNIIDAHDWGGDFAQYIQQAINIVDGKAQTDTHYIFNPHHVYLAPPAYPVGFPLLLAPVVAFSGNSIVAFTSFLTLLFIGLLALTFLFLKQHFGFIIALVGTLVFAYNPHMIIIKGEILSDIPFSIFFLSACLIYLHFKEKCTTTWWKWAILGLVIGYSLLIRSIGIVLLFGILIDLILNWWRSSDKEFRELKRRVIAFGFSVIFALSSYLIVSKILFPVETDNYQFYTSLFTFSNLGDTFLMTGEYYVNVLQEFFQYDNGDWGFAPLITKAFALTMFLIGFIYHLIKRFGFMEIIVLSYLLILLAFPIASQGFRYLMPIFPFMLYYMIDGLMRIRFDLKVNTQYIALVLFLLVGLQYKHGVRKITEKPFHWFGPQHPASKYAFIFIRENTPKDAVIIFEKPRVLGLYTERDSYNINKRDSTTSTAAQIKELGFDYILISDDLKNDSIRHFIDNNSVELDLVYERGLMHLYKNKRN